MKEKRTNSSSMKPEDFALLILTCFTAPLVAHCCDLVLGPENNPLTAEKILGAYFAVVAFYIIYESIMGAWKKTKFWEWGWRFGNSDLLQFALFAAGSIVAIGFYDTLFGTVFLITLLITACILLFINPASLIINSRTMLLIALIAAIIIPWVVLAVIPGIYTEPETLIRLAVSVVGVCVLFDAAYVVAKWGIKRKKQNTHIRERDESDHNDSA